MQVEEVLGKFFKPETQSSGRKLVAQEKVFISSRGDTAVQAYVRVSPALKVMLTAESIESSTIGVSCTCPSSKKGQFCKHVWATLLEVEGVYPDFLSSKSNVEKLVTPEDSRSKAREEASTAAKQEAKDRRKSYYKLQKERVRAYQGKAKKIERRLSPIYPEEVETALSYFLQNGFPMPEGPSDLIVSEAKRKLSRVFHPDKGGSHEESVQLNKNCDVIRRFIRN